MMKMFGQNVPRPIPKKLKSQKPEFNSIPIPPPIWGGNPIIPPKAMDSPPKWRGNPLFWGGESVIGMELNSGFCGLDFLKKISSFWKILQWCSSSNKLDQSRSIEFINDHCKIIEKEQIFKKIQTTKLK